MDKQARTLAVPGESESAGSRCLERVRSRKLRMDALTNTSPKYHGIRERAEVASYSSFIKNSTGSAILELTGDGYGSRNA